MPHHARIRRDASRLISTLGSTLDLRGRRWLLPLVGALGLSRCAVLALLVLAPVGMEASHTIWTAPLALVFFSAMAVTLALDSFARFKRIGALERVLRMGWPQTLVLVAGGVAVSAHRIPSHAPAGIVIGSCGALLMGAAHACSLLDAARTLARLPERDARAAICLSYAIAYGSLVLLACLPFAGAFLLIALLPLAYHPLMKLALHQAPIDPTANSNRSSDSTPDAPRSISVIANESSGQVQPGHATLKSLSPRTVRRSAVVIPLATATGVLALGLCQAADSSEPAVQIATIVALAVGLLTGLAITCRLVLSPDPMTRTPLFVARICLPLLAGSAVALGIASALWPLAISLSTSGLLVLDAMLLATSLPYLRCGDAEEARAIATARTGEAAGAAVACGIICLRVGIPQPAPTMLTMLGLLFIAFALCIPVRKPWPGSFETDNPKTSDPAPKGADTSSPKPSTTSPSQVPPVGLSARELHRRMKRERERYALPISLGRLTERQADVYVLLMCRLSASEVAHELGVTRSTITSHQQEIYQKFGVHSREQLADVTGIILNRGSNQEELPVLPAAKEKAKRRPPVPKKRPGAKKAGSPGEAAGGSGGSGGSGEATPTPDGARR